MTLCVIARICKIPSYDKPLIDLYLMDPSLHCWPQSANLAYTNIANGGLSSDWKP